MTAALFLGQDVDLTLEVGVGMNGAGLSEDLAALDLVPLDAAEQAADVVARLSEVEELAEHLDAGNGGVLGLVLETDDLDLVVDLDHTALDTAGGNGTTTGDGEDVLNRHKEGLVGSTLGSGDVAVDSVHELEDALALRGLLRLLAGHEGLESLQSGTLDDGGVVSGEIVAGEQLADLHLDELEELGIVDLVDLVHEDDDVGNADLTGEQDVLTGLGHRTVRRGNDEDSAVHLSSAGDHVLNIVGVAGAVDVSVVTLVGLVLNVSGVDGYSTGLLFGGLVDLVIAHSLGLALLGKSDGDSGGKGGLAVVNVTDGTDVDVGLGSFKLLLCHFGNSS